MIGEQLMKCCNKYSNERISQIPSDVMNKIGVKKISKKGITYREIALATKKMEAEEKRLERSRYQPLTQDEYID